MLRMVSVPEVSGETSTVEVEAKNRAEDVRNQLRLLRQTVEKSFLSIGAYMWEMREKKLYRDLGYGSLEDFSIRELEYGGRQVRSFVRVYEVFVEKLGIDETRLLEVGSTKLMALAPVVNEKNAEELFTYAQGHNVPSVFNKVAELGGKRVVDDEREQSGKPMIWQVQLMPSQVDLVNDTIEKAKRGMGVESAALALEAICADFQAGLGANGKLLTVAFHPTEEEMGVIRLGLRWAEHAGHATIGSLIAAAIQSTLDHNVSEEA